MTECFDETILQAFADGELAGDAAQKISLHLASCDVCAEAMREIESEMQMFAAAFECESPVVVPSEILRGRIESKIAEAVAFAGAKDLAVSNERSNERGFRARWREALTGFFAGLQLAPQFVAVCAVCCVGVGAFIVWQAARRELPQVARTETRIDMPVTNNGIGKSVATPSPANDSTSTQIAKGTPPLSRTVGNPVSQVAHQPRVRIANAGFVKKTNSDNEARISVNQFLPGEQGYVEAISSLRRAIETHGKDSLSPQVRLAYERNLAVVDRAILETRQAVRRDPKNADAKEFMLAAYQSKMDLLSNVAEQTQIASVSAR
ncbi:MAG: hypothetical protein NVSMB56_14350 [Pyrinomonadaceae bacterium]